MDILRMGRITASKPDGGVWPSCITKFGQTMANTNLVWPIPILAKPSLARGSLGVPAVQVRACPGWGGRFGAVLGGTRRLGPEGEGPEWCP